MPDRTSDHALSIAAVIPAHNAETTISRAIRSIERQSSPVDEIIVVDDHSTDGTAAVVARDHPAVRFVAAERRYAGHARNTGIKAATSEWVGFLDADDVWYPRKIERQLPLLTSDLILAGALCHYLAADARVLGSNVRYDSAELALHDLRQGVAMPLHLCGLVVSRQRLLDAGGFDETFRRSQDFELANRLAQAEGRIDWPMDEILVGYVMGSGSVTATSYREQALAGQLVRARCQDGVTTTYDDWMANAPGGLGSRLKVRSGHHYRQAGISIGSKRHPAATAHLAAAALYDPVGVGRKLRWRRRGHGVVTPETVPAEVSADF